MMKVSECQVKRQSLAQALKFNPEKVLFKVKTATLLIARLEEAATAFVKIAVEVIESPHSKTILQEMESVYRDLALQHKWFKGNADGY